MTELDREMRISDTYSDLSNLSNMSSPQINFTESRKSSFTKFQLSDSSSDESEEKTLPCEIDLVKVSLHESWFSGEEYLKIISQMNKYEVFDTLGLGANEVPNQPLFIYTDPKECIYFLKCNSLIGRGSFGFPRISGFKKTYEWKKMSFVTDLPSTAPVIRYITASCCKKGDKKQKDNILYRMHAVMPLFYQNGKYETVGEYVLVDIRSVYYTPSALKANPKVNKSPPYKRQKII